MEGGTFTAAIPFDPGASFDPYRNLKVAPIASYAYDSLVKLDGRGGVVPNLAKSWSSSARGATFALRSGITCSDGTPLKASGVAAALNSVLDPKSKATVFGVLTPSIPYTATADDARGTVKVTMASPFSFTVEQLGQFPIVCPRGLADPELLAKRSLGTGPFVLDEIAPGDRISLSARRGYAWGPEGRNAGAGAPSRVVLRIVPNPTTAANLLASGEVNAAELAGPDRERVEASDLFSRQYEAPFGLLTFNQLDGRPLRDRSVRTALLQALDLDRLAQVGTSGIGARAKSLLTGSPPVCAYDSVRGNVPTSDRQAARDALARAGWTDSRPLRVGLHYQTDILGPAGAAAVELIAEQWKQLGVETKLVPEDINASLNTLYVTHDWDVYWGEQKIVFPSDLPTYFSGPAPPRGNNYPGVSNPAFDRLAAAAQGTAGAKSCPAWEQAEGSLIGQANIVPVATSPTTVFGNGARFELQGLTIAPTTIRLFG
ncbi:ABC transporter substrate-binding protein [Conexibacter woesei]|uniref:ABC transporter substrate-binding protein n=1 Tax=Conexibacter woesei TaxID=191495 RepID=UPI0002E9CF3D|nr:ABC transporter substrate-binding protein [Conexibacter woesei]